MKDNDLNEYNKLQKELGQLHEKIETTMQHVATHRADEDGLHVGDVIMNQWQKKQIVDIRFAESSRGYVVIACRLKADGTPYKTREILRGSIKHATQ